MEQNFANEVLEKIKSYVDGDYDISTTISRKNNGMELTGIIIRDNSNRNKVEPIFYMDDYYDRGFDVDETATAIFEKYKEVKEMGTPAFDVRDITNLDIIRSRIKAKVVNLEYNDRYLEDKPYLQMADDLAVCFYVDINHDSSATIPITFALMDVWGLEEAQDLFAITNDNHKPAELITMPEAILGNMPEMDLEVMKIQYGYNELTNDEFKKVLLESQKDLVPMYVWRDGNTLGAAAMIYADNLQAALDVLGDKFYILPSSIHELIVLPYSDEYSIEDLKEMIKQVNSTELRPEEVLSDHPYIATRDGIYEARDEDFIHDTVIDEAR